MANAGIGRREFLGGAAASAVVWALSPSRVLGANDRIRLGMIGPGARGQELLGQLLKLPNANAELVAIADVFTGRHDEVRRLVPGVKAFTDHRRLLDLKDVDAVIVASPLHCHARHFLDSIAAGKDLYSEKTMTWSIPEAEACRSAAKQSNRVVQIGLQHVSAGEFFDARRWLADGLVGKVTHVESWMSRNTPRGKGQWVRPVPATCTADNIKWDLFLNGRPDRPFDAFKFINCGVHVGWRLLGAGWARSAGHDRPDAGFPGARGHVAVDLQQQPLRPWRACAGHSRHDRTSERRERHGHGSIRIGCSLLPREGESAQGPRAAGRRRGREERGELHARWRHARRAAHGELPRLRPFAQGAERVGRARVSHGGRGPHGEPGLSPEDARDPGIGDLVVDGVVIEEVW
ncbi:MAG: Gfo/Idh/MocA family oxidoreductase [Acidobacteria bacterium]|nr:Gfo/Idh/MocA family oxidoreductase [Acidobacteriota bacterium]